MLLQKEDEDIFEQYSVAAFTIVERKARRVFLLEVVFRLDGDRFGNLNLII